MKSVLTLTLPYEKAAPEVISGTPINFELAIIVLPLSTRFSLSIP